MADLQSMFPEAFEPPEPKEMEPFSGLHFANEKVQGGVLHGYKRGATGEGADAQRVFLPPRGAPAAVHVYDDDGQMFGKHPSILNRPHAYQLKGNYAIADIDSTPEWQDAFKRTMDISQQSGVDPQTAQMTAMNEAEWALKDAGYHGYRSTASPGSVVLFGDHPVDEWGKVPKKAAKEEEKNAAMLSKESGPELAEQPPQVPDSNSPISELGGNASTEEMPSAVSASDQFPPANPLPSMLQSVVK